MKKPAPFRTPVDHAMRWIGLLGLSGLLGRLADLAPFVFEALQDMGRDRCRGGGLGRSGRLHVFPPHVGSIGFQNVFMAGKFHTVKAL